MAEQELLLPSTEYLKSGIHIGTKFRTKYMARFIYKTRPDGLSVMNLQQIDERIKIAANFLSQYEPQEILVIGRRENAWKPLKALGKATGIQVIPGRYAPGMLTNPRLDIYVEPKIIVVVDAIPDTVIADQFRQYLEKTKQEVQKSNVVAEIHKLWDKWIQRAGVK